MDKLETDNLIKMGMKQLAARNTKDAEKLFTSILSKIPREVNALHLLGLTKIMDGDIENGVCHILKSISIDPNQYEPHIHLGQIFRARRELEKSNLYLKRAIAIEPKKVEPWKMLAKNFYQADEINNAIDCQYNICQIENSKSSNFDQLAEYLEKADRYENCIEACKASASLNKINPLPWIRMGRIYSKKSQHEKSISCYETALELQPDNENTHIALGEELINAGRSYEASQLYKRLSGAHPNSHQLHYNIGYSYALSGCLDLAITSYQNAINIKANYHDAHINIARLYNLKGLIDKSINHYQTALKYNKNSTIALSQLASLLAKQTSKSEAVINLYKQALKIDAKHTNSLVGIGNAYLRDNEKKEEGIDYMAKRLVTEKSNRLTSLYFIFELVKGQLNQKLNDHSSYSDKYLSFIIRKLGCSKIIAFGDSHVHLFSRQNQIECIHVGAATAYNLINFNSSTQGGLNILNRLSGPDINSSENAILLCFGEIDVRANIMKQVYLRSNQIEKCVGEVVERYINFAKKILRLGFTVIIYGGYGAGHDRLSYGLPSQREAISTALHEQLEKSCKNNSIIYFSLHKYFQNILCENGKYKTDSRFLSDGFHLNYAKDQLKEVQLLLFSELHCKIEKDNFFKKDSTCIIANIFGKEKIRLLSTSSRQENKKYVEDIEDLTFDLQGLICLKYIHIHANKCRDLFPIQSVLLDGKNVEFNQRWESENQALITVDEHTTSRYATFTFKTFKAISAIFIRFIDENSNHILEYEGSIY